jgi:hypothetical protein
MTRIRNPNSEKPTQNIQSASVETPNLPHLNGNPLGLITPQRPNPFQILSFLRLTTAVPTRAVSVLAAMPSADGVSTCL